MIKDLGLEMPKNAKAFVDTETGIKYAVHYDHVVLAVNSNNEVLDLYPASQTSCDAIRRLANHLDIVDGFFDILMVYNAIHNKNVEKISNLYDWSFRNDGYSEYKRYTKADWKLRADNLDKLKPTGCRNISHTEFNY